MTTEIFIAILGVIGGGVGVAGVNYFTSRNKMNADARSVNVTAEISLTDKAQELAERMYKKNQEIEERYEALLKAKDERIALLEKKLSVELDKTSRLERELERYRAMKTEKAERSRGEMHASVDKEIDALNRDEGFEHEDFKHPTDKAA